MPGLFAGLEIGKRALLSTQVSMQTIGHNIANVNTPGYTRQRVMMTEALPESSAHGPLGSGVRVDSVRHMRDLFLGRQYREAQKGLGEWTYKQKTMDQIENLFNEPQDGSLGELVDQFFNSWSTLETDPTLAGNRSAVVASANELVHLINQRANSLIQLRDAVDRDIVNTTEEVNRLTTEIAHLNFQIKSSELGNFRANDLRDQRDLLIDQLSNTIDVNVMEQSDGTATVSMGSMILVDGVYQLPIGTNAVHDGEKVTHELVWQGTDVGLKNVNGELAGLLESRDSIIPRYLNELDQLARTLVESVNSLHEAGYGLNGSTGVSFFDPTNLTAASIRVSREIELDINRIAASGTSDIDVNDAIVAQQITALRDAMTMNNGSMTMTDFYTSMVGKVGIETREATSYTTNFSLMLQQVDNQRQSVQGVNLDEEMVNLVKYQQAYDAAARVITTMDQALDTIIHSMGLVGR
ncbi:MAG: flagellar hook-associated protein FlgK [candidate division Zixibacteria bacterium]|nr:flagellar hook-associated protein FlgK [candidate division Zixibacteria bacterium]